MRIKIHGRKFLNKEKDINSEVQNYLIQYLSLLLDNQRKLIKYKIEDIKLIQKNMNEDSLFKKLDEVLSFLINGNYINRIEMAINSTPIFNNTNFNAGKILYTTTDYKKK